METINGRLCLLSCLLVWGGGQMACGEPPIHASELDEHADVEPTPTDARFILEGDYFRSQLDVEEDWIVAHTTAYLWIPVQNGDDFDAYLKHEGEQLTVGGVELQSDKYLMMQGTVIRPSNQIYLYREEAGYILEYDANISPSGTVIDGYFTFQGDYDLFAEFKPTPGY